MYVFSTVLLSQTGEMMASKDADSVRSARRFALVGLLSAICLVALGAWLDLHALIVLGGVLLVLNLLFLRLARV